MDSIDNVRERFEALEQRTAQWQQHTLMVVWWCPWWLGIVCGVLLLSLVNLAHPSQAADFACAVGDVACLINAINQANANGEANTITLEAGTYTLTAVDNTTDGDNGLPSVTSTLTIRGAGAETTIIARGSGVPAFRLVHIAAAGMVTLDRLTLQGGLFPGIGSAGGILNRGTLTLHQSIVAHNNVDEGIGGIDNRGTLTLQQSTVAHNTAALGGTGGILNDLGGTLLLTESAVVDNHANGYGGIFNDGVLFLTNSTVANNSGSGPEGTTGGIRNGGTALLTNATMTQNHAEGISPRAGGINNDVGQTGLLGQTVLVNTILAGNTSSASFGAPAPDCAGVVTSLGHNLIGDPTGCTITLQLSDLTGAPGLDTFTDNGTPGNGHFPLLPASQAIDTGNDAVCPRTDQLRQRRIGPCDIGAIRFLDHSDVPQATK